MTNTELDRFPVADLPDRYEIDRSTFYARIQPLNLTFELFNRKKYASAEQVALMDELHQAIQTDTKAEFFLQHGLSDLSDRQSDGQIDLSDRQPDLVLRSMLIEALAQSIATGSQAIELLTTSLRQPADPLSPQEHLERVYKHDWRLTTNQVKEIIGVEPRGASFPRYGFLLVRSGREGRKITWEVRKPRKEDGDRHWLADAPIEDWPGAAEPVEADRSQTGRNTVENGQLADRLTAS